MSQNTDPFPTPRGALSPEGVSARVPAIDVSQHFPYGGPLVPGYAGAKGAVPGPLTEAERRHLRDWAPSDDMEGAAFVEFVESMKRVEDAACQSAIAALQAALERERVLREALKSLADDVEDLSGPMLKAISTLGELRSYKDARRALAASPDPEAGR